VVITISRAPLVLIARSAASEFSVDARIDLRLGDLVINTA